MNKTTTKTTKLSPAMERLVGILTNQMIWGGREQKVMGDQDMLVKQLKEVQANLYRLQGEATATVNGIMDNDNKLKMEKVFQEAQAIVDKNMADKRQPQIPNIPSKPKK